MGVLSIPSYETRRFAFLSLNLLRCFPFSQLIIKLMQTLTPAPVIDLLSPQLTHTSWRVREEIVNTVIIALSTFGRDQFDLPRLAR